MKIKHFLAGAAMVSAVSLCFTGCGETGTVSKDPVDNTVYSQLTGEAIDSSIKDQRPVAVMIDNESVAYPHYGIAESDVVYEMMNSTLNGRITRLMCLVKDWDSIEQMGSVRSSRPTNVILQAEWNSIFCHDGGPSYVNEYLAKDYAKDHLSGVFSRVNNGKAWEFTEYILKGDLQTLIPQAGISTTYTDSAAKKPHFNFVEKDGSVDFSGYTDSDMAEEIELPFYHTQSKLVYNDSTGTYDYYAYGEVHKDAEDDEVLTFTNVILQKCPFEQYDEYGYMIYDVIQSDAPGYYISDGKVCEITWTKTSEDGITTYYDENGKELKINRGKTYIALIPSDSWSEVEID